MNAVLHDKLISRKSIFLLHWSFKKRCLESKFDFSKTTGNIVSLLPKKISSKTAFPFEKKLLKKCPKTKIYYNENLKSPDFEICIKNFFMGPSLVLKNRIENGHCYRDIEKIQKGQRLLSALDTII